MSTLQTTILKHPDSGSNNIQFDSSGQVGIGTSPGRTLDVSGSIRSGGSTNPFIALNDNTTEAYFEIAGSITRLSSGTSQPLAFRIASSEAARFESDGRLLVGTSSATDNTRLDQKLGIVSNSSSSGGIRLTQNPGTTASAAPIIDFRKTRGSTDGSHTIVANGDNLGYITFGGADGTDNESLAALITAVVDGTPGSNDMPGRLSFRTTADGASSPTERMRISNNGFVDIPGIYDFTTASAANVNIDSTGGLRRSTSSSKYKTNIETLEDGYADAVLNCRPVWYRSTTEADNPEHGHWGFIAEEVAEIDPRLVHWKTVEVIYDENGSVVHTPCDPEPEGVAYDRFVPHLLNLIKRQQSAIETLEAKVAALEAE